MGVVGNLREWGVQQACDMPEAEAGMAEAEAAGAGEAGAAGRHLS